MTASDWHTDAFPELRPGPPWVMQEMIAAQPAVIDVLLRHPPDEAATAVDAIRSALQGDLPVTVCGCGTSEHAAHAIATLLGGAAGAGRAHLLRARPSLDAALDPRAGVCIAISHDGETRATVLALDAARAAGAHTIAITQAGESSVARAAELALLTPRHDDSWCHTIAYTSAIAAGAALAAGLGPLVVSPDATAELVRCATADAAPLAARLADRRVVLCAGALTDHITARELALKLAEGARMPTVGLELETVLHGQLAGHEAGDALILVAITDHDAHQRLARRTTDVARAAGAIGLPVAALLSDRLDAVLAADLTPGGRMVVALPDRDHVDPQLAGLLAGAGALQTLTVALAGARQTNPDLIRREQEPYRRAAQAAEGSGDW